MSDSSVDQCVYILHELNMDQQEAWGERNDEDKIKFSAYREAMKKDPSKKNEIGNVATINLEFNEAEQIIIEQKKQIGEKEREFKKIQETNQQMIDKQFTIQEKIEKSKKDLDEKLSGLKKDTEEKNLKN